MTKKYATSAIWLFTIDSISNNLGDGLKLSEYQITLIESLFELCLVGNGKYFSLRLVQVLELLNEAEHYNAVESYNQEKFDTLSSKVRVYCDKVGVG